jgi:hypothetical protein
MNLKPHLPVILPEPFSSEIKLILFVMRRKLIVFFVGVFVCWFSGLNAQKFSQQCGHVEYTYEVGAVKTITKLVFNEFGKNQLIEVQQGESQQQVAKTIIKDSNFYIINYDQKQVIKVPLAIGSEGDAMDIAGVDRYNSVDLFQIAGDILKAQGEMVGETNYLNKKCNIYQVDIDNAKGRYWVADNMVLKAEIIGGTGEHIFISVTKINFDTPVDANLFAIPSKGFQEVDMSGVMKQLQQMHLNSSTQDGE